MHWYYKAKAFDIGNDEIEYGPIEVYEDDQGEIIGHTMEAVPILAESPEELVKWLRQAASDIEKYGVINGDED